MKYFKKIKMVYAILIFLGAAMIISLNDQVYAQGVLGGQDKILADNVEKIEFTALSQKVRLEASSRNTANKLFPSGQVNLKTDVYLTNPANIATSSYCGDGYCDIDENYINCGQDCRLKSTCGDLNQDGMVDGADAQFLLRYIFSGGAYPNCLDANVNGDSWDNPSNGCASVNISDVVYLISYLYCGGPRPTCLPECGNGICGANEDKCTCPEDCEGWCSNDEMAVYNNSTSWYCSITACQKDGCGTKWCPDDCWQCAAGVIDTGGPDW